MAKFEDYDQEKNLNHPDIADQVDLIFQNYSLEELLEMNEMTPEEAFQILYNQGLLSEPASYLP